MAIIDIRHTNVLTRNLQASTKIVANQGSSGSSKTWSLAQKFMYLALTTERPILISIVGKTFPALRATAMRDFFLVLREYGLYSEINHNKSEHIYRLELAEIEFFSADQPHKLKGRKRDYLWMSEADAFTWEDWIQLSIRTNIQISLDYNPSEEFHWIYEQVLTRNDCTYIHSTYKDNTFLEPERVKEIERLALIDENYWRVYGLGERGSNKAQVYTHAKIVSGLPMDREPDEVIYGLDFGYNHPMALVRVSLYGDDVYTEELIYERNMTNGDLIARMQEIGVPKRATIWADPARADAIEEIYRAGFNIHPAEKNVLEGIKAVKSVSWYIPDNSPSLVREYRSYKWKQDKNGKVLDEPVKFMDDLMDAVRYPIYNHLKSRQRSKRRATWTFPK